MLRSLWTPKELFLRNDANKGVDHCFGKQCLVHKSFLKYQRVCLIEWRRHSRTQLSSFDRYLRVDKRKHSLISGRTRKDESICVCLQT